jgi:hypothetical protein
MHRMNEMRPFDDLVALCYVDGIWSQKSHSGAVRIHLEVDLGRISRLQYGI